MHTYTIHTHIHLQHSHTFYIHALHTQTSPHTHTPPHTHTHTHTHVYIQLHKQGWCNGVITGYDDLYRIVFEAQMVLELVYFDLMCIAKDDGDIPDIARNCGSRT